MTLHVAGQTKRDVTRAAQDRTQQSVTTATCEFAAASQRMPMMPLHA